MHTNEDQWLEAVYRDTFPQIATWVHQSGGDLAAAKDLFHDAMIIYLEKRNDPAFTIRTSPKAYIAGIAKILWIKKFRNDRQHISLDVMDDELAVPEEYFSSGKERRMSLMEYVRSAGKRCMELLQSFYYEQLPMQKIAEKFNYSTTHSATVQKYKCLEKLREQIKLSDVYEEVTP